MPATKLIQSSFLVVLFGLLQGCASYYSHYGSFVGNNSAGDERRFVVSWQTAEYPDWYWSENNSTAILLETQCSERRLYFTDERTEKQQACNKPGAGIVTCGDKGLDLQSNGTAVTDSQMVCGSITSVDAADHITDLDAVLRIKIDCWPSSVEYEVDGEKKNRDYLKFSVAPYTIRTKKVARYSLEDKIPVMSDKICKEK